jgi:hypothetical protein
MELDHIIQAADDGPDTADNAIPLCFDCHAEVHAYNDRHPRGRKFSPDELRGHKEQWLRICRDTPNVLLTAARDTDVGPLQALINELEFNLKVAEHPGYNQRGCPFKEDQFNRAIREGAIWGLDETVKSALLDAYRDMGAANKFTDAELHEDARTQITSRSVQQRNQQLMQGIAVKIQRAYDSLVAFVSQPQ